MSNIGVITGIMITPSLGAATPDIIVNNNFELLSGDNFLLLNGDYFLLLEQ